VRSERGFTLLEMMVATVILAVAIVGLMSGISGALRNAARLTDYDRAVQLARLRMNELVVDERIPRDTVVAGEFDPEQSGLREAGWRARLANFEMPPAKGPGQISLDRIELEIWWMSGAQRRTFTLDAYRPHVLRPQDLTPVVPE
jgi:general secretion pathway protein I